jgi:hypothetical protein
MEIGLGSQIHPSPPTKDGGKIPNSGRTIDRD